MTTILSLIQDTCRWRQRIQMDTTCIWAICIWCKRCIRLWWLLVRVIHQSTHAYHHSSTPLLVHHPHQQPCVFSLVHDHGTWSGAWVDLVWSGIACCSLGSHRCVLTLLSQMHCCCCHVMLSVGLCCFGMHSVALCVTLIYLATSHCLMMYSLTSLVCHDFYFLCHLDLDLVTLPAQTEYTYRSRDTSAPRHFGTIAEVSGHFGTGAEVSDGHFGIGAEVSDGHFDTDLYETLRHHCIFV